MSTSSIVINMSDIADYSEKDYIPMTLRKNSLADLDLNFIQNTINTQNLENNMNMKIMGLRNNFKAIMALHS